MKVLQVNCVYQVGSTGKIVGDIHRCLLAEGISSVVCYGRGKSVHERNVFKFCTELEAKAFHLLNMLGWLMYAVCPVATGKLIRIIKKENPDIVHLHCINGHCVNIYRLLHYLSKSRIKTVVTHHAEFFYTGNCGHAFECAKFQNNDGCNQCPDSKFATGSVFRDRSHEAWVLMKESFDCFDKGDLRFTAVSPWTVNRSLQSPILNRFSCKWVPNGIETSVFKPSSRESVSDIREKIGCNDKKVLLFVSASFSSDPSSNKGGVYIKQLASMMPHYQFVVVATYIDFQEALPGNVYVWGRAKSQTELAELYSAADLSIVVSKRETFSMVVAESLCCGTPLVGFKSGGPESIAIPEYTRFVDYGNVGDLRTAIEESAAKDWDSLSISLRAHSIYSKEAMANGYLQVYRDLYNNGAR